MPKKGNVLIFQGGGVTPVINQSLAGVVQAAVSSRQFGGIYGASNGLDGVLQEDFRDLRRVSAAAWRRVSATPGAALGSSRRRLKPEDVEQALDILHARDVTTLLPIGGNDSAESAHSLATVAVGRRQDLRVVVVPKTIDNDLPEMDHCPGYGSAARFIALATMGVGRDAESMGEASPITVLEVMGRNAGWLAAASTLGKSEERDPPHFVAFPEVLFDQDVFIARIEGAYRRFGFAVAVVCENLKGPNGPLGHEGEPLYVDQFDHPYFQSPGQHLATTLSRRMGLRVRFEKPGAIQRSLVGCVSAVDASEAYEAGARAVSAALGGQTDAMVTLLRGRERVYRCRFGVAPLTKIATKERVLPTGFMEDGLPSNAFITYAKPLVGLLPVFARLD